MCAGNKAAAAQKSAAYQNAQIDDKQWKSGSTFKSKEAQMKKGNDANVIGRSRNVGDATAKAMAFAGQANLRKAIGYAQYTKSAMGRGSQLDRARRQGRNTYLQLLNQNREIEYAVNQTWDLGMKKSELGANRVFQSNRDKLLAARGFPTQPGPRVPHPKRVPDYLGTFNKIKTVGAIAAAPFTGGASLTLLGIGGMSSTDGGEQKWNLFN